MRKADNRWAAKVKRLQLRKCRLEADRKQGEEMKLQHFLELDGVH